ncbi:MAG: response regulator [Gammaproteobacteria bacterium]|nr:response regulator [Gammaproteobacteria bacterium]
MSARKSAERVVDIDLGQLRLRLIFVGIVLLVLLAALISWSNQQFSQQRQAQAVIDEMVELSQQQSVILERLARDLLIVRLSLSNDTRSVVLGVTEINVIGSRLSLREDIVTLRANFDRLREDLARRPDELASQLPVLVPLMEDFEEVLGGYFEERIDEHATINSLLSLKSALAPAHAELSARYRVYAASEQLMRQHTEGWLRIVFALVVMLLVGLALFPALREVRLRLAEAARLRARLGNVVAVTNVGTWEWNCDSGEVFVNERWLAMLGHTRESFGEVTPDTWRALVHPDDQAQNEHALKHMAEASAGANEVEFRMRHREGHWVWIKGIGNTLEFNDDGTPHLMAGLHLDNTRQRELQQALVDARTRAESANHAKSEFLANMSHEIRTPMTAILGYLELLQERLGDRDDHESLVAVETVRSNARHLLALINDILDLSKIEAGHMRVEAVSICLPQLLLDVQSLLAPRAEESGVGLRFDVMSEIPEQILSDPTRLRQILLNIVGNALKFTREGEVEVQVESMTRPDGEAQLQFRIRDTGMGIPEAHRDRLFQPFSQADSSVTRSYGGTGLGLVISRRLAQLLGGDVRLDWSAPGRGSQFVIDVRLQAEGNVGVSDLVTWSPPSCPTIDVPRRAAGSGLVGRILLAEDGPDNQRLIAFHLRRAGADVTVAANGYEALECLKTANEAGCPYDLLVTDIQMPEMDGCSLARELRRQGMTLPIIALTAHAMADDRVRCLAAGCDDYATKPIDRAALIHVCARWLAGAVERRPAGPPLEASG